MSPKITVENIQKKDIDEIVALGLSTPELQVNPEHPAYYGKEELASFIKSPNDIYLVAKVNGKFAGYRLATYNPYLKEAYLIDMVVKEEYRGLGVATKLYERTFEILNERECYWVWVLVAETNEKMLTILQKKGFKKGRKFHFLFKLPPY